MWYTWGNSFLDDTTVAFPSSGNHSHIFLWRTTILPILKPCVLSGLHVCYRRLTIRPGQSELCMPQSYWDRKQQFGKTVLNVPWIVPPFLPRPHIHWALVGRHFLFYVDPNSQEVELHLAPEALSSISHFFLLPGQILLCNEVPGEFSKSCEHQHISLRL